VSEPYSQTRFSHVVAGQEIDQRQKTLNKTKEEREEEQQFCCDFSVSSDSETEMGPPMELPAPSSPAVADTSLAVEELIDEKTSKVPEARLDSAEKVPQRIQGAPIDEQKIYR